MKKNYLLTMSILFCSIITHSVFAQKISWNATKEKKVDSLINVYYKADKPGVSVLISNNSKILMKKAVGMADMEKKTPLNSEKVFAIGSISKQFTAVAMLKLVEMGKVNLQDDFTKYIPGYKNHGEKITVENLLTHTSGISSFTEMKGFEKFYQEDKTIEEIRAHFEDSALLYKPATNWSYSNSGYFLSAYIIEKVSGKSFEAFVQQYLFDAAGMKNTYFGRTNEKAPNMANGYDADTDSTVALTKPYSWSWPWGAGSILSTSYDMYLWNEALNSGKIIKKDLLKKAFTPYKLTNGVNTNYGYGWGVYNLDNKTIVTHGGAIGGYLADAFRINETNTYVVLLTNTTDGDVKSLLSEIMLVMTDKPIGNPKEISLAKNAKEFEGIYEMNYSGLRITRNSGSEKLYRTVRYEGDSLTVQRSGRGKVRVYPYATDEFFIKGSYQRIKFLRDKEGKVVSLYSYSYPLQIGPGDICPKTDLPLPKENAEIKVSAEILNKYVGIYELAPTFKLEFFVEDGRFYTQATGQQKIEVFAKTEKTFFLKVIDATIDFNFDEQGNVISLFLTQGRKMEAKKIK